MLSEDEIKAVTSIDLDAAYKNNELSNWVASLEGIEHFTALKELNCSCTNIRSLDVSKNPLLEILDCSYVELTSLDVSHNPALTSLFVSSDNISSLDVSHNPALTSLSVSGNDISSLDVSHNPALISLSVSGNGISSLDVSKNPLLESLTCYSSQLTSLDVSHNPALTNLSVSGNDISSLDVSKNPLLESLTCRNSQLTSLDVSHNPVLTALFVSDNNIKSLDVSDSPHLWFLNCDGNPIEEIKLHYQTYENMSLSNRTLHGKDALVSDLVNIVDTDIQIYNSGASRDEDFDFIGVDGTIIYPLRVVDPRRPATYKYSVNGSEPRECRILYTYNSGALPARAHLFYDYTYAESAAAASASAISGSSVVIYGNGGNMTVEDQKVNWKQFTMYTDILPSYSYKVNKKGVVKASAGKVVVGITKSDVKPEVVNNKIIDREAAKIAKAKIKNGQITVTAAGKEKGLVYLWVIDTGNKGTYECCPIHVLMAPKKLEVQDLSGNTYKKIVLANLDDDASELYGCNILRMDGLIVKGFAGTEETKDCTYTVSVDKKFKKYVEAALQNHYFINSAEGYIMKHKRNFVISCGTDDTGKKPIKAAVTFTCLQNGKKVKQNVLIVRTLEDAKKYGAVK